MKKYFKNKSILVTGASGSIGSQIVKKLLKYKCKVIRAMSNDENGMYLLSNQISAQFENQPYKTMLKNKIRFLIGDVRDYKRNIEATKNIDIVIHAAAMKHVPICEYNPSETFKTNVIGTEKLIKASIKNKVSKFLFISTDKAVKPGSVMGSSKLSAENLLFKFNISKVITKFSVIRFGNIIGSRGSVILKFLKQIKKKKYITITHKKMTRFFITIDVAINEIINVIHLMKGNELFVINKMHSFKILDLALALKKIFNHKKKLKFVGLRPGEKLHEDILTEAEAKRAEVKNNLIIVDKNAKDTRSDKTKIVMSSDNVKHLDIKNIIKFLIKNVKIKKISKIY